MLKLIRFIDKYAGMVICAVLVCLKVIAESLRLPDKIEKKQLPPGRILIIKLWGIGSMMIAAGAFKTIRENFPSAHLAVFTLKQNVHIYEMLGFFDEIISVDIRMPWSFLFATWRNIFHIRKSHFEVAIDFEFTSCFTAIITYLTGAGQRIGFHYAGVWRGKCYTAELEFKKDKKIKDSFIDLINLIGTPMKKAALTPPLQIKNTDKEYIDNLLYNRHSLAQGSLVGININAGKLCLLRRWPKEYFVLLAEELMKRYPIYLIFVGDADEVEYVEKTIRLIPSQERIFNLAGKTTLVQLTYLLSKLKLFISNDSGPLHLAAYLNVPTVSFFGPETPLIYGPDNPSDIVLYKKIPCSPCIRIKNYKFSTPCKYAQTCLRNIKPKEVIDEIERKGALR